MHGANRSIGHDGYVEVQRRRNGLLGYLPDETIRQNGFIFRQRSTRLNAARRIAMLADAATVDAFGDIAGDLKSTRDIGVNRTNV